MELKTMPVRCEEVGKIGERSAWIALKEDGVCQSKRRLGL